jgi:hypothetical protein
MNALKIGKQAYGAASEKASKLLAQAREHGTEFANKHKLTERSDDVLEYVREFANSAELTYGTIRQKVKPNSPVKTPEDLLQKTQSELHFIIACVLQISPKDAAKWAERFGNALAAKLAAAGTTATLLGLVSVFGTAGTGAAISGLSGAAATSATLAWVGGLVGGGMAAGTFLTAGVGLVVGYATYRALGSTARSFDDLKEIDRGVVETCGVLAETMNEALSNSPTIRLDACEAEMLFRNALEPLYKSLSENSEDICSRLDLKNAIAFRQHALPDFKRNVIDGFSKFISANERQIRNQGTNRIEYVIGGVLYALLSRNAVGRDMESQLVLDALRRSDTDIAGATESEISEYLSAYSPDQLKGIASNVKGIYHELLFVEDYNATHTDSYAEIFGATNHPGSDIRIRDRESDETLQEIQLKATNSADYVQQHVEKYPDIEVRATEEVAAKLEHVESSGVSNEEISYQISEDFDILADNTITDQIIESAGLLGVIAAGREAIEVLQGRKSAGESTRSVVEAATAGAAATGIAAFLFS